MNKVEVIDLEIMRAKKAGLIVAFIVGSNVLLLNTLYVITKLGV